MPEPKLGSLVGLMALFVLLGIPMVAFLWEVLHEVLTLRPDAEHIAIAVPVLALFIGLLVFIGRRFRQETAPPSERPDKGSTP